MSKTKPKDKSEPPQPRRALVVKEIPQTPEERAAAEKMLATPCPYCSDPKKYQQECKQKGRLSHTGGVAPIGKFWARDDPAGRDKFFGMVISPSYFHGDHYHITHKDARLAERFKDFSLHILTFESSYSAWGMTVPSLIFMLTATPGDLGQRGNFRFDVQRITHRHSPVVVDSHTWFSHGTIITVHHLPREFSSADVSVMQEALEFFRPEERGAPKITEAAIKAAIKKIGPRAQQKQVAEHLGVTAQGLTNWRERRGLKSWGEVVSKYSD